MEFSSSLLSDIVSDNTHIPKIKILGVGGAGGNIIDRIIKENVELLLTDIIAVNTDSDSLRRSLAPNKLTIGNPNNYGAGGDVNIGREAALKSKNELLAALQNTELLFIIAGMGGGTGTGASSVIASIARELNILTVATVTTPLKSEGTEKQQRADAGIKALLEEADTVFLVDNEKSIQNSSKSTNIQGSPFDMADKSIMSTVKNIHDMITIHEDMNIDFADLRSNIKDSGIAFMGEGRAKGPNALTKALQAASSSNILKRDTLKGAKSILVNMTVPKSLSTSAMKQALDYLGKFTQGASTKFGINTSNQNYVKIAILGSNFTDNTELNKAIPKQYIEELEIWAPKVLETERPAISIKKEAFNNTNSDILS